MNILRITSFLLLFFTPPLLLCGQINDAIQSQAEQYVGKRKNKSLVIATWQDGQPSVQGYGQISKEHPMPPTGQTRYGIGGMSAIFTTALMQEVSRKNQLDPAEPIGLYLPAGREVPNFLPANCVEVQIPIPGQPPQRIVRCEADTMSQAICMTFCDLASHVAGLGNTEMDWTGWNPISGSIRPGPATGGPNLTEFWDAFEQTELLNAPGRYFHYSNLGIAALGQTLAEIEEQSYDRLLATQLASPLRLSATTCQPGRVPETAPGHDEKGRPVATAPQRALNPTYGIYSNAQDLLTFASQLFDGPDHWQDALQQSVQPRFDAPFRINREPTSVGYGWFTTRLSAGSNLPVHWINGGLPGYRSFLAIQPDTQTIVVILASGTDLVDSMGWSILRELSAKEDW